MTRFADQSGEARPADQQAQPRPASESFRRRQLELRAERIGRPLLSGDQLRQWTAIQELLAYLNITRKQRRRRRREDRQQRWELLS